MMLSKVDLPHPLRPTRQTNWPSFTCKLIFANASALPRFVTKIFDTFSTTTFACAGAARSQGVCWEFNALGPGESPEMRHRDRLKGFIMAPPLNRQIDTPAQKSNLLRVA